MRFFRSDMKGTVEGLEIVLGELLICLRESDSEMAERLKSRLERQLENESLSVNDHNTIVNQLALL